MKNIWIPQSITVIILIVALNPSNPYGYYILLRWVCCSSYVYLAIKSFNQDKTNWSWIFGIIAVAYNPIIRIHLNREIWTVINLITIAIAIISIFVLKKEI